MPLSTEGKKDQNIIKTCLFLITCDAFLRNSNTNGFFTRFNSIK